jgi:hypothetical protein
MRMETRLSLKSHAADLADQGSVVWHMGDHVGQQESADLAFVLTGSPMTLGVVGLGSSSLSHMFFDDVVLEMSQTCGGAHRN